MTHENTLTPKQREQLNSFFSEENEFHRRYTRGSWWISVEERLPKEGDVVLVYSSDEMDYTTRTGFSFGELIDGELMGLSLDPHDCGYGSMKITHWMPLPDKPE